MREIIAMILSWLKKLFSFGKKVIEDPGSIEIDPERPGPGEVVCYYGCPNSNRAKKLQLEKKLYR